MIKRQFFTPPECAAILGTNAQSILRFIDSGQLRAVNTSQGRRPRWRVSQDDWEAFLDSRSNQSPAMPEAKPRQSVKKSKRRELPAVKEYV